ncbi:hypothetical protein F4782DRAFT_4802 [Xylaria castorea]|nr:hypothetical protein F4782DRAFT_4802 [Xylaria castorea]
MAFIGPKIRRHFIPARNSRHRTACLALYRALLRLAPRVSLPDNLAAGWGPGKNPIAIHIRRAFQRNVADTSPRIIHPALSAGYRMLSVLHDAATTPSSTHHAEIVTFLGSRLAERQRSLAHRPPPPKGPKPGAPRPGTLPLFVKVWPAFNSKNNVYQKPEYATPHRPRPRSELGGTGRRQVPRLDAASDFPFLRLTKPEPPLLSRVLRQKLAKRVARTQRVIYLRDEVLPAAVLEDEWDTAMARLMREEEKEKKRSSQTGARRRNNDWDWDADADAVTERLRREDSHADAIHEHGLQVMYKTLTVERHDLVARADAMRRLIIREKALVDVEKQQRAAEKRARWEAKMLELHGATWRDLFPNLKESEGGESW